MDDVYSNIDNPAGLASIEIKKVYTKITRMMLNYFFRDKIRTFCIKYYREKILLRKYKCIKPEHILVCDIF